MLAMKKLLAIAWNDIRIELSDRSSLVFLIALPLLFTWVVGSVLGGTENTESTGDNRYALPVVDLDGTAQSRALATLLESSLVVRPLASSTEEADKQSRENNLSVLTIPAGFGAGLIEGGEVTLTLKRAGGDPGVLAVEQAIRDAAGRLGSALSIAHASVAEAEQRRPFTGEESRRGYFEEGYGMAQALLETSPALLEVTAGRDIRMQQPTAVQQAAAGQLVTWVLITLAGVAEVLVSERLWGTLPRLFVTPAGKANTLGGKVVGRLSIGLTQTAVMIGFGVLVLGVDWGHSPAALAVMVVAFSLSAVAFGIMLSTFSRTRNQAGWLTIFFGMTMAALGGAWWPLEVTPPLYQQVVKILPTTWAMQGLTEVIVRGQDVAGVLPEAGILLAFAAAFFAVGLWRFRFE
jgi:ABC-2 type transport system permease protein